MIEVLEPKTRLIPAKTIVHSNRAYAFRLKNPLRSLRLKDDLQKAGQREPIILEEINKDRYRILDGFLRFEILSQAQKKKKSPVDIQSQIIPKNACKMLDRFRVLAQKNFFGKYAYGLYEKSQFISFFRTILPLETLAKELKLSYHQLDDCTDFAGADPYLARVINKAPLEPAAAAMLFRRYQTWRQTRYQKEAFQTAHKLLHHAKEKNLTMKSWRFYLDFYWKNESTSLRPSFSRSQ